MIKAIIFDLDNTLYEYHSVNKKSLEEVYKTLRKEIKISKSRFLKIFNESKKEVRKELDHSPDSHDRIVYFKRFCEKLDLHLDLILKLYHVYSNSFLKLIRQRKGVKKTFKRLKEKKLKIIVLTNEVVEIQLKKLKQLGLTKYIDYFITSEDVGVDKPDKKIFLYVLKKIKTKPSEVIMVGDSEKDDIFGANQVKIKNVLLTKKIVKSKANFIIKEIPELLKRLNNI